MTSSSRSTSRLLHLLLLADLFASSLSRPTHGPSLYSMFGSMIKEVDNLMGLCKQLHGQSDDVVKKFAAMESKLQGLPVIGDSAADVISLTVNKSLAQLYVYTQSFKLHMDWLKLAKENVSMSGQSAENISVRLLALSNHIAASLQQISQDVPQSPTLPASFPTVSTVFNALEVSIEVAEHLKLFCMWSNHVLHLLRQQFRP